ncbi:MAG TPA: Gfo/Idh/MocA family oxidoreductase [Verrucomicrobiota bacterium]|nr:Gfo/Idh/MocA family oxidoreductase [Verrucomicrobiota bacterium]HRZ36823.1 Gfo/Idh/MocA family oxidoreductase [Candidatus Paceibacterota bacterium]HRZ56485.1 Gfo/Idh/MocA family oxidoreductase [Candidatus Paceibacterota bacterium]
MNTVRLGIIGLGNIGKYHAEYLLNRKVTRCALTAVADAFTPLDRYAQESLKTFTDGEALIRSGLVDAVVIATPHYQHTTLGISAIEAGLHVMVEKPISVHKADAERLIAAHRARPDRVFAAMFQLRTEPRYMKIKRLIEAGDLGTLVRTSWIMTDWYRTEAYYASGGWRATWKGEGGGVLLNQCPHNLDILQWLCGMPQSVRGFCQLGRYHAIEVEDNVTAYWAWANGATGVFVTSTGEAPGTNRLEICGTRGRLVLEDNRLRFTRNEADMIEFSRSAKAGFARPDVWNVDIPFDNAPAQHATLMQNFVDAILDGAPLVAPGEDGLRSVELANAMLYSSILGQTVELPLDGAAYERTLGGLIAQSKFEKKVAAVNGEDFTKSFVR